MPPRKPTRDEPPLPPVQYKCVMCANTFHGGVETAVGDGWTKVGAMMYCPTHQDEAERLFKRS